MTTLINPTSCLGSTALDAQAVRHLATAPMEEIAFVWLHPPVDAAARDQYVRATACLVAQLPAWRAAGMLVMLRARDPNAAQRVERAIAARSETALPAKATNTDLSALTDAEIFRGTAVDPIFDQLSADDVRAHVLMNLGASSSRAPFEREILLPTAAGNLSLRVSGALYVQGHALDRHVRLMLDWSYESQLAALREEEFTHYRSFSDDTEHPYDQFLAHVPTAILVDELNRVIEPCVYGADQDHDSEDCQPLLVHLLPHVPISIAREKVHEMQETLNRELHEETMPMHDLGTVQYTLLYLMPYLVANVPQDLYEMTSALEANDNYIVVGQMAHFIPNSLRQSIAAYMHNPATLQDGPWTNPTTTDVNGNPMPSP